ncbi:hypothetical protein GOFOIKOB_3006 [Methylobacterium tardum]|uniref:Uncharacterized protein n=1 Tax=Methylobacterium tardum TaxID=374432 RepID=A0AA37TH96_9HYPH|nr:hypothetical protein [Methylobacterium tardum]URD38351.1 hypothetical protein M6G65_07875 [Methylobacterium tardum]GJE49965.1 hypothetical protein GOFOIKOB_3006 [Methylobacterium tardum]GLS70172.1 hypothetical protein GCM10007890_21850 [Methylobacterium tardum]
MGRLGDVQSGRVYVDCSSCKRSGRYTVASLIGRYGADISTVDVLRHLTASCPYQRPPGAPPTRKYEHLCLAAITLPPPAKQIPPVPPGVPYTIEVWRETGGNIELHLATIYPLAVAKAAFDAACREWPTHEVTLRDRARIIERRERPLQSASASDSGGSG